MNNTVNFVCCNSHFGSFASNIQNFACQLKSVRVIILIWLLCNTLVKPWFVRDCALQLFLVLCLFFHLQDLLFLHNQVLEYDWALVVVVIQFQVSKVLFVSRMRWIRTKPVKAYPSNIEGSCELVFCSIIISVAFKRFKDHLESVAFD